MIKSETKDKQILLRPKTIIISGSSRLPENITAKHVYGFFCIELEVDPKDSKIVDCSCTLVPSLGQKILYGALLGETIEEGIRKAIEEVETRFYSVTKRAVIAALEDAYKWYQKYKK